jgi:hypothetical protein
LVLGKLKLKLSVGNLVVVNSALVYVVGNLIVLLTIAQITCMHFKPVTL